jgi:hypothetical protein
VRGSTRFASEVGSESAKKVYQHFHWRDIMLVLEELLQDLTSYGKKVEEMGNSL